MKTQMTLATLSAGLVMAFAVPAFAQADTDECDSANPCDGDDVCVTYTFESCSGEDRPSCAPGETCMDDADPAPEPTCETSSESYCVPPYLAPCEADADCGGGFTCEALESCACSGGGSTGEPGMDGEPQPAPDCSCEPSGENYCRLIEVECDADEDCDGELTCQEAYGGDAPTIACAEGEPCPEPDPVEPTSHCAPEGFGYYGGGADGGGYGEAVAEATGRDDASVTQSEREEFFPVDGTDGDGGSKQSPSSCSTASGGSGGSLLLLLAGLMFGRRRRRS